MKRLFGMILALALLGGLTLTCGPGMQRATPVHTDPIYLMATPENRESIDNHKIGIGMSIPECRLSWRNAEFFKVSESRRVNVIYETWKVENYSRAMGSMSWIYLHVENGRVVSTSQYKKYR